MNSSNGSEETLGDNEVFHETYDAVGFAFVGGAGVGMGIIAGVWVYTSFTPHPLGPLVAVVLGIAATAYAHHSLPPARLVAERVREIDDLEDGDR